MDGGGGGCYVVAGLLAACSSSRRSFNQLLCLPGPVLTPAHSGAGFGFHALTHGRQSSVQLRPNLMGLFRRFSGCLTAEKESQELGALAGLGSSEQLSFLFVVVWKRKEQLSSGADFLTSLMRKPLSFGCSLSLTGPGLAVAVGLFLRPGQRSCGLEKAGRVLFMSVTGGWQCCPTGTV